jgi:hypothetical protein
MSEKKVHCPLCGSSDITPRSAITVYGNREASVSFLIKGQKEAFGSGIGINVGLASICLDCGHLMWACAEKEIEKLRAQKAKLLAA